MTFGEKLYRLRKEKGWTQERLAEQIGVSRQALSKWESGSAVPDAVNILRLSKLFAVSADYLLDDAFESSDATWAGRPSGQARRPASWAVLRTAAGVCAVSVSLLGMLLLGILSSAFPWRLFHLSGGCGMDASLYRPLGVFENKSSRVAVCALWGTPPCRSRRSLFSRSQAAARQARVLPRPGPMSPPSRMPSDTPPCQQERSVL